MCRSNVGSLTKIEGAEMRESLENKDELSFTI